MAHDLRTRRVQMPVIPSSETIKRRLAELKADAARLNILLRTAIELEQAVCQPPTSEDRDNA